MNDFTRTILEKAGVPDLLDILDRRISSSELNSLLLALFDRKTAQLSPADLMRNYEMNRLVKPFDLDPVALKALELDLFRVFAGAGFKPIELSPVSPLGACSAIGKVDQKKVVSGLRGAEVMADATNAIALHICQLKKAAARVRHCFGSRLSNGISGPNRRPCRGLPLISKQVASSLPAGIREICSLRNNALRSMSERGTPPSGPLPEYLSSGSTYYRVKGMPIPVSAKN